MDATLLAEDATRFHERFVDWGRYGISAFHAASDAEVDVICQTRLVRFATVVVFRRAELETAGVGAEPLGEPLDGHAGGGSVLWMGVMCPA